MGKRRRSPLTKLLGNLADDTKGFVDDLTARAADSEGHARDALEHAVGDDGDKDADRREIEELSSALAALTKKVNRLAKEQGEAGEGRTP
jgi:hypothetical protein